jgi:UbiD family decarboxylase
MRAYQDLRAFLRVLEEERQLLRVTEEVLPEPDLGAAARAVTQLGETSPALYFDRVMRERTGSILPGAVTHGLEDVLASVPSLLT